jgi:hypothetical protein
MVDNADKVIVILSPGEIRRLIPKYLKRSKKVAYWRLPLIPKRICSSFPPADYEYYIRNMMRIKSWVDELVNEIG